MSQKPQRLTLELMLESDKHRRTNKDSLAEQQENHGRVNIRLANGKIRAEK